MSLPKSATVIKVFISYSHKDESLRDELTTQLSLLRRQGFISDWHDRKIVPGDEWAREIDRNLNTSQIILLLVSADFIASDYCYGIELKQALKRHKEGKARVIPIILRPVDWEDALFGKLQALPKNAKPVTTWPNRDEAYLDIAKGIREIVKELNGLP